MYVLLMVAMFNGEVIAQKTFNTHEECVMGLALMSQVSRRHELFYDLTQIAPYAGIVSLINGEKYIFGCNESV